MTHADLVRLAARWLSKKYAVVVTEITSGESEEPDAIGFGCRVTTLIECKVSRADFKADRDKPALRMGDYRYYLVPTGLVGPDELPAGWGLLYVGDLRRRPRIVIEAPAMEDKNWRGEQAVLVTCIRRLGFTEPKGVSIKFYTMQTKCRATLHAEAP